MKLRVFVLYLFISGSRCSSPPMDYYYGGPPMIMIDPIEINIEIKARFAQVAALDGKVYTSEVLWSKVSQSLIQCNNLCEMDGDCNGVFYNAGESRCNGSQLDITNMFSLSSIKAEGTKFYTHTTGNCLSNFNEYQGKCYAVFDLAVTWDDAWENCKDIDADLLNINSTEAQTYVANLLTYGNYQQSAFWLGHTYSTTSELWQWRDRHGNNWPIEVFSWQSGEPNGATEFCASMYGAFNWNWIDHQCSMNFGFICQTDTL